MEPIMSNTGTDNALFYIQSVSVRFLFFRSVTHISNRNKEVTMEIKLLTTKEVAEKLHCSTHQVAHLRQHGLIRGTRFAKYWMYSEEDINNFILKNLGQDFWHFRELTPEAARKKYAV